MTEAKKELRKFRSDPKNYLKELHASYGLDRQEFSKVLIITSTALLMVSIHAANTMNTVQKDLQQTEKQVQEASAIISSESFQDTMDTLQRVQSDRLTNQLESAQRSFNQAQKSFERISTANQKVKDSYRTYQWMSLIGILGVVSGVALRFM